MRRDSAGRLAWVGLFALAFGLVEAAVVIYLRGLYYPEGFAFPLRQIPVGHIGVELGREAATIAMLAAVGMLAGKDRWSRFGFFCVAFGLWDIFFYAWLKVLIGWPASVLDWDILFLLPVPWIGPVVAPLAVALILAVFGAMLATRAPGAPPFRPGALAWIAGTAATLALLYSFMHDTAASLHGAMPLPYWYWLLCLSLLLYGWAMASAWKRRS